MNDKISTIIEAVDALNKAIMDLPDGHMIMMNFKQGAEGQSGKSKGEWVSEPPQLGAVVLQQVATSAPNDTPARSFTGVGAMGGALSSVQ